jgi:hypothetical protein
MSTVRNFNITGKLWQPFQCRLRTSLEVKSIAKLDNQRGACYKLLHAVDSSARFAPLNKQVRGLQIIFILLISMSN